MTKIIATVFPPLRMRETIQKKEHICWCCSFMRFYDALASLTLFLMTSNPIFVSLFSMFTTRLLLRRPTFPFQTQTFLRPFYPLSNKWDHTNICTGSSLIHNPYLRKQNLGFFSFSPTLPHLLWSWEVPWVHEQVRLLGGHDATLVPPQEK